ncbi:TIGR00730 family Rossman fold protein [Afifella sp. IM 167]|uniref:LOG family protein n=1 Tax=Afifella sp. IM 167 TaxID=2033586 RepID=UPI001CC8F45A|nr:TIGR00730 family Rossman fold protein [Afifella sp. IM 167]MBZ8134210.1 TIGR00730 family Rossman fold protein [Afifella sp. IM 167]
MRELKNVCVYCGSAPGERPLYLEAAETLGRLFATEGIRLVYGGGSVGLMGRLARSVLDHGGAVTGIIPGFLEEREKLFEDVTELIVTADMHERKRTMFDRSDAFVALPGGIGTLEEMVEMMTWAQLGQHAKPVLVANIAGFWQPFLDLVEHMRGEAFIRKNAEVAYLVTQSVEEIVPVLREALAAEPENGAREAAKEETIRRM